MHEGRVWKIEGLDIDKVLGNLEVGHLLGGKTLFTVAKGYISI